VCILEKNLFKEELTLLSQVFKNINLRDKLLRY
jgi:hypothetical protein